MSWFLREVWPEVRRLLPSATFLVAGRGLDELWTGIDGVVELGRVDSLSELIRNVDVMISPVVNGLGAPLKFAECLASGRPVVATRDGAAGRVDTPALIPVGATEWVHVLAGLLADRPAAAALGERTRAFALDALTWERTTLPMIDKIVQLSGNHGRTRVESL